MALAHGAFWFTDSSIAVRQNCFRENLDQIKKELKRSKEEFIQEHFQKYTSPDVPPVWKTLEITSFGLLSKLFCNIDDNRLKKKIARDFNLPQHLCLESWIKSFVALRNCIAHTTHVFGIDVIHNNHKSQVTLEAYGLTHLMCEPISYMPSFVVSLTCKIIFIRRIHLSNRLKIYCRDMAMSTYTRWDFLAIGKTNLCGDNI